MGQPSGPAVTSFERGLGKKTKKKIDANDPNPASTLWKKLAALSDAFKEAMGKKDRRCLDPAPRRFCADSSPSKGFWAESPPPAKNRRREEGPVGINPLYNKPHS